VTIQLRTIEKKRGPVLKTRISVAMMLLFGLLLVVGCGPSGPNRVKVSGKVTYKGQPVPTGSVTFLSEHNLIESSPIVNGDYSIARAPVGNVKVGISTPSISSAVESMQLKQKVEGKSREATGAKAVVVPESYRDPEKSGLSYSVSNESSQTHDIPLK
jgi:hypothetical protein